MVAILLKGGNDHEGWPVCIQEGGLWRPRVLHEPKRFIVSEFHVARGGNAYGKPSSFYDRGNITHSSPPYGGACVSPRYPPAVRRERLDPGGLVCPRLHGETRTRGNGGESGRPAPADG